MNRNLFAGLLLLASCCTAGIAHAQGAVTGRWRASGNSGYIEIYKRGPKYYGKLLNEATENGKPKLDVQNPKPALRTVPLQGLEFLKDFEDEGDGLYENGTIYDPRSGKSYKGKLTVKGNILEMRGFVGFSLLGKTQEWTRSK